jgi:hypothetical protein
MDKGKTKLISAYAYFICDGPHFARANSHPLVVKPLWLALVHLIEEKKKIEMGPGKHPTTRACFVLALLAPTCLLPTKVKDLSLHHRIY